ncbi:DNA repair rhp42 [Lecanosticta acicola]|uniref:DNA repair rhp42 n=1 Tax=Lecanosticta acicola TaxID=111012 RepID=A0AAI8YWM6_9PEZI|nr:DNA repair rhp42 [Lecanosticta acicola]
MAPKRGKGKAPARLPDNRGGRRTTRSRVAATDDVPDVYQDMLREADGDGHEGSDRPLKRRKVVSRSEAEPLEPSQASRRNARAEQIEQPTSSPKPGHSNLQTVEESSEDDASDLEFEDVDLEGPSEGLPDPVDDIGDVAISVQPESSTKPATPARRKPATFAEKAHRLVVHKLHVLCLLGHCMYVNGRCNNATVQRHVRSLLSSKTVSYLTPKTTMSQFDRNRSFMDGLQQAVEIFVPEYRVTGGGMTKAQWDVDGELNRKYDHLPPMDRSNFIEAAKDLQGSQDVANQLFCALLRSAGVETRLVCSLQVLPFTSVPKAPTPKKPAKEVILAMAPETPRRGAHAEDSAVKGSASIGKVPSARRRLGQPSFAAETKAATPTKKKLRPVPRLSHPVFWVEAFNAAQQKWIAVDPIVTRTVNKPAKLEPSLSYELNQMTYVIGFENDGAARDVTKRYAKAYNAKTRRHRVETSSEGTKWFKKVMRIFRRREGTLARDQVEDAELAQKEAREGMPANVLDFKDHPYYALERHLKRHEVLHPKREVGKVNAGTAAKSRMEPVYRRQDVLNCKSADKWYRLGREIKEGEQPLKRVPARTRRPRSPDQDDAADLSNETALYAPYQTQLYIPPPVQRGRIPKNGFGNLDIYVPSMVPSGGVHIRHQFAQQAAKLLRIDYADAVTGFKFQGRHGTAVIEGVVVAEQYDDAIRAVIEGFEEQVIKDECKVRSIEALKLWKRFLTGLRIQERVSTYGNGLDSAQEEGDDLQDTDTAISSTFAVDDKPLVTAGQYTLRELQAPTRKPKPKKRQIEEDSEEDWDAQDEEPLYAADEGTEDPGLAGGFLPTDAVANPVEHGHSGGFIVDNEEDGGGFLAEDADDEGGGGFFADRGEKGGGFITPEGNPLEDLHHHDHDEGGGGFVPDEAVEEVYPDDRRIRSDGRGSDLREEIGTRLPEEESTAQLSPGSITSAEDTQAADAEIFGADQEASDNDSMPSHDPEDDDAEPDWLESD